MDGPLELNCTVQTTESGRSKGKRLFTFGRNESERSQGVKVNGPKGLNWTVLRNVSGRFKGQKLDDLKV